MADTHACTPRTGRYASAACDASVLHVNMYNVVILES